MKLIILLFTGAFILLFTDCTKDSVSEKYTFYRPVYKTKASVQNAITAAAPTLISNAGKIVWKDHYIFLNEVDKGVHIIDIANPANPVNLYYIAIPGCVDIAVNGNYLYADCYTDLVTIDISNPANAKLKKVNEGVFPHRIYNGYYLDTTNIITEWLRIDTVVTSRFSGTLTQSLNQSLSLRNNFLMQFVSSVASIAFSGGFGVAGSMARFALSNERMYTVSNTDLKVFNISQAASPEFTGKQVLPLGDIETIFPYKQNLFIGSRSGMFIYNTINPDQPQKRSQFIHSRSCDPVIADDNFAYITLWGGSSCGGFSNQLDIVDIRNLSAPTLLRTYPLTSPKGLSKDGDILMICDGKEGLKLMNVATASFVTPIKTVGGFEGTDVIAYNGIAIVTAKDGLYCINYTNPSQAFIAGKIGIFAQ
jgi:hypothetical protein